VLCQHPVDVSGSTRHVSFVPRHASPVQEWARYTLAQRALDVIGITGSVGKTTAKEAIAAVLGARHPVFKNRANYNGIYGLPIALGELLPEHRVAVLEMAPTFGEIAPLPDRPTCNRVVTTVERSPGDVRQPGRHCTREGDLVAALHPAGWRCSMPTTRTCSP